MKRFGVLFVMLLGLCACSKPGNEVGSPDPTQESTLLQINENVISAKSPGVTLEMYLEKVIEGGIIVRSTVAVDILPIL